MHLNKELIVVELNFPHSRGLVSVALFVNLPSGDLVGHIFVISTDENYIALPSTPDYLGCPVSLWYAVLWCPDFPRSASAILVGRCRRISTPMQKLLAYAAP
jgi:hypothetical protein